MIAFQPTTNAQDWRESIEVLDDTDGTPFDLTGWGISIEVRSQQDERALIGDLQSGHVSLTASGFEFVFPRLLMKDLSAGTYYVHALMTGPDGEAVQPFTTTIGIIEGGHK